jgi:hypothetical protein
MVWVFIVAYSIYRCHCLPHNEHIVFLLQDQTVWIFMLCWPCISIYVCNETNLMHHLSSVYSVTIPLHILGLLVTHHQQVKICICNSWYVLVDCQLAWLEWNVHSNQASWESTKAYITCQLLHIYIVTSWWWATSKPETSRSIVTQWTEDK